MGNKILILAFGILISLLNLFDAFATNYGYNYNLIEELNPLMDYLLKLSPELFLLFKFFISILIVTISFAVYYRCSERFQKSFLISLVGVSVLYTGISFMHLTWLSFV
ncbi:DUF5658 family protein [Ureibacillus sp. MALMAid1270]|uniref:DUF5658 family protein n=1 Tax=Ureibacillus sp. MALMAid1270 TaxID=3411629 RepID=UPI003BA6B1A2